MKFSEISIEEKTWEAVDLVLKFSKNVISDLDRKIKEIKPKNSEYSYIDLIVESYFSIQSVCILLKEGLISSASAILRIIIEQVSIVSLLSKNKIAKRSFEDIKKEKRIYYSSNVEKRKKIEESLYKNKEIPSNKIKQYFDYGRYKDVGCKQMNLRSICDAAKTTKAYDLVDDFLNGFAHGQRSIYEFRRQNNSSDKAFILSINYYFRQLFLLLLSSTINEFENNVFSQENHRIANMIEALDYDINTRINEKTLQVDLQNNNIEKYDTAYYRELIDVILCLLDNAKDKKEKYLLSQSFLRLAKQIIVLDVYKQYGNNDYNIDPICIKKLFKKYNPDLSEYNTKNEIILDDLIYMIDRVDDNWTLGGSSIDYSFVYCVNNLLEIVRIKHDKL